MDDLKSRNISIGLRLQYVITLITWLKNKYFEADAERIHFKIQSTDKLMV